MDWNAAYENRETPWEKGRATPVLDEISSRHPAVFSGRAWVPGCGVGHDARRLADFGLMVTAVDVAPLAIEAAKNWDETSPVDFQVADVFSLKEEFVEAFDMVWEHTCFCALDPALRVAYLKSLHAVLMPGGKLAGVFFINPEMDDGETGPPFGVEVETLRKMLEDAGFEVVDHWVPVTGYEGRVGRELAMILEKTGTTASQLA
ncbi:methyltransferase domain-containing protein [Phragmitibacter flavus]|uniref:Methyltransferase domain-containing protein n=1 Tax=Phragmitibacter flavus TaxID=2576071 RepID=A0A5R8KCY7_9BACT|nr:methyltransferase domain-containing protein [Phragmitibacter flavus]TLD69795.1 methyltransferase domain-containing protein [Phragmitibacter flavus]